MFKITLLFALIALSFTAKPIPLEEEILVYKAEVPKLEADVRKNNQERKTSENVQKITSEGYSSFVQSSEFQRIDQLDEMFYGEFLDDFLAGQGIQGKLIEDIKQALLLVLKTDGAWVPFKFIFSDKRAGSFGGNLGFMFILVQRIAKTKEINFVQTKTSTAFKMFPDLVVITKTTTVDGKIVSEDTIVREEEKKMSDDDLSNLMKYFELVSIVKLLENVGARNFPKLATISALPQKKTQLRLGDDKKEEEEGFFSSLIGNVNQITEAWKGIVSAFKTTKSESLKEIIAGKGYDKMLSTSYTDRLEGLEGSFINEFLDDFKKMVNIPDGEMREALFNSIKYTKYTRAKTYNGNHLAFTKGTGGRTVFVTFMHRKNSDNTYNIIYSYFNADFSLAPDMWVWNKDVSVAGGIYENHEEYVKEVPRSLTQDDIKGLMDFMTMMNFKSLYASLGIDLPLPTF